MAKGVCYVQVKPVMNTTGKIMSLRVEALTQSPPISSQPGCRVVKLEIEIPDAQLLPITVRAMVDDVRLQEEYEATMKALGKP